MVSAVVRGWRNASAIRKVSTNRLHDMLVNLGLGFGLDDGV